MRLQRIFGVLGVLVMLGLLGVLGITSYDGWQKVAAGPGVPSAQPYPEPSDPGHKRAFHEVCPAINRPEVLALVGDPATMTGQGTSYMADSLGCFISGGTAVIRLDVGRHVPVSSLTGISTQGRSLTVLGRPALLETWAGRLPRSTLTIAREASDSGDYATIMVFTEVPADEATMVRLAELILPHVAGWTV
jgi:hypothetical protein